MDYWFMTPVSNPDNTTQELPLSLVATDHSVQLQLHKHTKYANQLWRPTNTTPADYILNILA
ncbi:hypothetical protein Taro_035020 [Colocasia esculenta]|uniref:Uncharacterized protein n=1 Tax=Colocasia esculenta TaxID=4460 RepID=A0A843WDM3_COLES|nr:hypothetical protein [Colocasia esculenta]